MDRQIFFTAVRSTILGPTLDQDEVAGCEAILDAMGDLPISWTAYALATAYHETAGTMQPIKEYGGVNYFTRRYDISCNPRLAKRLGNTQVGDGAAYCGRGYVQLTGRANYAKAGDKLGHDLIGRPDLAMRQDIAASIMRLGMREGWFTGRSFQHYLPVQGLATADKFTAARKIINGNDKASKIAGYAVKFQNALLKAGAK